MRWAKSSKTLTYSGELLTLIIGSCLSMDRPLIDGEVGLGSRPDSRGTWPEGLFAEVKPKALGGQQVVSRGVVQERRALDRRLRGGDDAGVSRSPTARRNSGDSLEIPGTVYLFRRACEGSQCETFAACRASRFVPC